MTVAENPITAFRQEERHRYSATDQNIFAMALSQIDRYYRFLQITKERFDVESKQFIEINSKLLEDIQLGVARVTEGRARALDDSRYLQDNIQLDIESFYVFAKITLDKAANFLELYFGPARGLSLRSHDRLVKNLGGYADAKGLILSKVLAEIAESLKATVTDFRDKQIEHHNNPRRMIGIGWSREGDVSMFPGVFSPKESDPIGKPSTPISLILSEIDRYLNTVFEFIKQNRAKTRFEARETELNP